MKERWFSTSEAARAIGVAVHRDWIYGLMRKGLVKPKKLRRRRNRYFFSERDVEIMKRTWAYCEEGYKLDVAWEKSLADHDEPPLPGMDVT